MALLSDLHDDFDASLTRLCKADQDNELRRSLNEVLNNLYTLRENLKSHIGSNGYFEGVRSGGPEGRVAEGLVGVRAFATHHFTKSVEPRSAMLYPGVNVFPGHEVFPGHSLQWLQLDELAPESVELLRQKKEQGPYYGEVIAGRPVLSTLLDARRFLRGETD